MISPIPVCALIEMYGNTDKLADSNSCFWNIRSLGGFRDVKRGVRRNSLISSSYFGDENFPGIITALFP
jgi:hypothetical protein